MSKIKYFLGIDPGLSEVGFGIISSNDEDIKFIDCGIIKTVPLNTLSERLSIIKNDLNEILNMYEYSAIGVEELFFGKNVTNAIKVAHSRGVILESINAKKFNLIELTPNQVKKSITGSGSADKLQIQEMVKRILKLSVLPKPHDASDALAIAISIEQIFKFQKGV